jgi:ParB/RepB/Spo0J family partition protein
MTATAAATPAVNGKADTKKGAEKPPAVAALKVPHTQSTIPVGAIKADPKWNSRVESDNEGVKKEEVDSFAGLVQSIKDRGLLEAIVVRPMPDGKSYAVVAGFRRFAACKEAGLKEIPCNVVHVEEFEAFKANLAENEVRDPLHPYELGMGVKRLKDMAKDKGEKITNEEIGIVIGKSKAHVGNLLRCVENLAPRALMRYKAKLLSMPEAMKLAKMVKEDGTPDKDAQLSALDAMDNARHGVDKGDGEGGDREAGGKVPQVLRRPALEELLGTLDSIETVKVRTGEGRKVEWKDLDDVTPAEMADTILRYILKPTKEPPFTYTSSEEEEEGEEE